MFEDSDLWPVQCPNCLHKTKKEIGWLKTNRRMRCDGCGLDLWHHPETFLDTLNDAQRAVASFNRSIRAEKKEP